jgi:hypothetical protein
MPSPRRMSRLLFLYGNFFPFPFYSRPLSPLFSNLSLFLLKTASFPLFCALLCSAQTKPIFSLLQPNMSRQPSLHQALSIDTEEEEEEALSLSDLPSKPNSPSTKLNFMPNPTDDFEFRISISANETDLQTEMCAADDVFCNGTILPLRPSISSHTDSMDLSVSSGATVMSTSRSGSSSSSGSSSYCVSRSHSTKSASLVLPIPDPPRHSVSNNFFYAFPSPSPQIRNGARKSNVSNGRKSTSSVPGTILRLGVLPAPEIDIRSRRTTEKKPSVVEKKKKKKKQPGFSGYGFGCKCVPDEVVEPAGTPVNPSKLEGTKKKKNGGEEERRKVEKKSSQLKFNLKIGESMCRTRIFNWLEELSI